MDVVLSTKLYFVYGEKSSISVSVEKLRFYITVSFILPLKMLRFFFQSRQPNILRSLRTINRSPTLSSWPSVLLSSLTCTFYVWKASNLLKGLGHPCRYWDWFVKVTRQKTLIYRKVPSLSAVLGKEAFVHWKSWPCLKLLRVIWYRCVLPDQWWPFRQNKNLLIQLSQSRSERNLCVESPNRPFSFSMQ